jgi:chloramphenicol O-acetyltransferase type B
MIRQYWDKSILMNPLLEYLKWFIIKSRYQIKYWGKHLRIGYKSFPHATQFGKFNFIGRYSIIHNCQLGDFTYCSQYCDISHATIGKYCSIGPGVNIAPGRHPTSTFVSTHPSLYNDQPDFVKNFVTTNTFQAYEHVTIGNDVWIGANVIILDGVTIGNGAIIAANSVVNKNVGNYEIVGGLPAKLIRKRFSDEQIAFLTDFKWWDKSEEWIQENIYRFSSINDFINIKE